MEESELDSFNIKNEKKEDLRHVLNAIKEYKEKKWKKEKIKFALTYKSNEEESINIIKI